MHCDNCMGGGIDNTYTYCSSCLEASRTMAAKKARDAERRRMMKIMARDEFYPTLGCMDEMRPRIVDAINDEVQK